MAIYIVDDDLGFVFWLGHLIDEIGYEAVPAKACPDAIDFLNQTGLLPDLLVVNPRLPGVSQLLSRFRHATPKLKVLLVHEDEPEICEATFSNEDCWTRPDRFDDAACLEWRDLILSTLDHPSVAHPRLAS